MSTIQQNGSATTGTYWRGGSTNNNHGTAKNIGTVSTALENSSLGRVDVGVFGSTVVDGVDTDPALSAGVFAYKNNKPIALRYTTSISTVSNNVLLNASIIPDQLRSINKRESFKSSGYATAIRAGYFNLYTGKWTVNPTPVTENPGTDNAATPTRSVPGELVYKTGASLPVRDNYKAKTG